MPPLTTMEPFPPNFRTQEIQTNGTTLYVRIGGHGPAVVLLHGYGATGDMWTSLAADLMQDRQVIVPDLRGLGLSSKPPGGFDKKTQAGDIAGVLGVLGVDQIDLVAHDIGNMVADSDEVSRLLVQQTRSASLMPSCRARTKWFWLTALPTVLRSWRGGCICSWRYQDRCYLCSMWSGSMVVLFTADTDFGPRSCTRTI